MTILKPRCMIKDNNQAVMGIAYCSNGYLLPCCWLDGSMSEQELIDLDMYNESLKLENNNSVEEIIRSSQWKNFIRILTEEPQSAPRKCHTKCKNG